MKPSVHVCSNDIEKACESRSSGKMLLSFYFLLVFIGLSVFFYGFHPQVLLDYDDWSYISGFRLPLPLPNFWNPSRILPECLMPLCGFLGSCLFHLIPSLGYVWSISIIVNGVLVLFIVLYLCSFACLCKKCFSLSPMLICLLNIIFLFLHFLAFLTTEYPSPFLFTTTNMTCCFFYLIPALLNSAMVMLFLAFRDFPFLFSHIGKKQILLLVACYFAVFSNLFGNVILATYLFVSLCVHFISEKIPFSAFLRKYSLSWIVLIAWVVSVLMESLGGRARLASDGSPAFLDLSSLTMPDVFGLFNGFSTGFLLLLLLTLLLFLFLLFRNKKHLISILFLILTGFLCGFAVYLLCAKVDYTYFTRIEVSFGLIFYLFLVLMLVLITFIRLWSKTVPSVILLMLLIGYESFLCLSPDITYANSYSALVSPENCLALSQYIVDQVVLADEQNLDHTVVHVAKSYQDTQNNWPQSYTMGEALSDTLYRHRVIKNTISIDIYADEVLNKKYDIYFY